MKKTFRYLNMAALLAVGAIMTGCSSDDNIDNPQQPANNDNVVTLTATVSLDQGAGTRAIDPSGKKTFDDTNTIAIFYEGGDGNIKYASSGTLTLSDDKTKATFTVTLDSPKSGGKVRYVYPASMTGVPSEITYPEAATIDDVTIDYTGLLSSQNGDLTNLGTNYDLAVFDGTLSGASLSASATLTNPLAVCKFKLTDGSTPITVTSLNVSDGTYTYHVTPSGLSEIYVAMKPVASKKIAFTASTGSKTYFKKTASAQTLAASTFYTDISVSMVELAVGKVIGFDGNIYATKAAAGTDNAAAMIAYLGSETDIATYTHGLAIALSDEISSKWSTARSTCEGKSAITGAVWLLPSQNQWKAMFNAFGGNEDSYSGLNTAIGNAEGTALQESKFYWSSSEYAPGISAWDVGLFSGKAIWYYDTQSYDTYIVRACLAF